jgi:hypothetical protein
MYQVKQRIKYFLLISRRKAPILVSVSFVRFLSVVLVFFLLMNYVFFIMAFHFFPLVSFFSSLSSSSVANNIMGENYQNKKKNEKKKRKETESGLHPNTFVSSLSAEHVYDKRNSFLSFSSSCHVLIMVTSNIFLVIYH